MQLLALEYPQVFNAKAELILNDALQQMIYESVLHQADRPSRSYYLRFVKLLIETLERHDQAINETILEDFTTSYSAQAPAKEYIYKSYCITDDKWITLKNEAVYNLVGMTTWGAAYLLSDFILANKQLFQGHSVLELGAGTGLVGVVLNQLKPDIKQVVLTDYAPVVLNNLIDNMNINGIQVNDLVSNNTNDQSSKKEDMSVVEFDWEADFDQCDPFVKQCEVIVGADIVYEPSLCRYLVSVLNQLLQHGNNRVAYIASTIRNESTFATFQQVLDEHQLLVTDITHTSSYLTPSPFEYDRTQIVLFQIQLRPTH
ncbi:hypothetical protein SAMD00019534_015400 [Acytostelium subglobosum LB1]|uniref:hypothetical protein n=1 Tax=Acytostelium subglobosum LB1 TaxID=1410327 RepID=UPI000644EE2A|nr:hypothetical protein SAMD00019534_015400 [Acytostelium subglobosum LB1]GAM18365.1 hypothetical protein SAMD00019534_015400 [Acytostelium subglobosum LB1]|eukprot:XP_012757585.1 hypothetical protein SAMD00019534_015400 [Acytostelium subglobosum LB1]